MSISLEDVVQNYLDRVAAFARQCEEDEYTDTDEVWALLTSGSEGMQAALDARAQVVGNLNNAMADPCDLVLEPSIDDVEDALEDAMEDL